MAENLQVKFIDLLIFDNAKNHYTNLFELVNTKENAILRRGQKFSLAIHFENRNLNEEDSVRIIFSYGKNPNPIRGTQAVLSLRNICEVLDDSLFWALNIIEKSEQEEDFFIILEIISPPDCLVGIWNLKIETAHVNLTTEPTVYKNDSQIYLLFNPWCSGDTVYMADNWKLDEYILNDVGKIWIGPQESCRGREWIFGQFDACVLPACMLMFNRSGLADESRGDAIKISRIISKLVNSEDDKGILIGRWDGEYFDGIPPAAWTGSVDILKQFYETQAPVSYGQCWIFAGVVTTICRALGIPSRVVSNLISAQDASGSLTIDKFYDENNEEKTNYDFIWNYHVWNDVWMARPDLKTEKKLPTYSDCSKEINFDGWQAIDATPTEKSHGFYQCGPAPLQAIKTGIVGLNFDVSFMLASVNADIMRWKEDSSCEYGYSKIHCNKKYIGRRILTKMVRGTNRENITCEYKAQEGSNCERACIFKAIRRMRTRDRIIFDMPDAANKDMEFSLDEIKTIELRDSFNIVVKIKNKSDRERTFDAILSARSIYYNGVRAKEITKKMNHFKVLPNSNTTLKFVTVEPKDYLDKLVEYGIIKIHAICTEKETNLTWVDEHDFQVEKPPINIKISDDLEKDKDTTATLVLENPLKVSLTNCKFYLAGPGIRKSQKVECEDIEPESQAKVEVTITPKAEGLYKLIATFTSNELVDITGSAEICI